MSERWRDCGSSQPGVGLCKGLGLLSSPGGPRCRLRGGAGVTGDSLARAPTPRWAPSALAWDAPPVQITLNPSSLLTCTKLGQPGCLGTTRLMTRLQQPMCL